MNPNFARGLNEATCQRNGPLKYAMKDGATFCLQDSIELTNFKASKEFGGKYQFNIGNYFWLCLTPICS